MFAINWRFISNGREKERNIKYIHAYSQKSKSLWGFISVSRQNAGAFSVFLFQNDKLLTANCNILKLN